MNKKYVVYTIIILIILGLLSTVFLIPSDPTPSQPAEYINPQQVEFDFAGKDLQKIIFLKDEDGTRFYITEEEVQKNLTSENYQKNKNWRLRVFVEITDKNTREALTKTAQQALKVDNKTEINYWCTAIDLAYNHQDITMSQYNRYIYNTYGQILLGPQTPNIDTPRETISLKQQGTTNQSTFMLYNKITDYVNEYLAENKKATS